MIVHLSPQHKDYRNKFKRRVNCQTIGEHLRTMH